jgi:hypothetical protein
MRWVTYVSPVDGCERAGVLRDDAIHGVPERLIDLLAHEGLAQVGDPVEIVPAADARLRAPVPSPPSIRDFMGFEGTVGTGCILELSRVHGTDTFPWLRPGDRVRLEVERLGSLESTIDPAQPLHPL